MKKFNKRLNFSKAFRSGWTLLENVERYKLLSLAGLMLFSNIVDMLAVGSVMPLVGIIIEPRLVESNKIFMFFYELTGSPAMQNIILMLVVVSVSLLAFASILKFYSEWAVGAYAAKCQFRLSATLASSILNAPYAWFANQNSTLLGRVVYADVGIWGGRYIKPLVVLIGAVLTLLVAVTTVLIFSPQAGLMAIAFVGGIASLLIASIKPKLLGLGKIKKNFAESAMLTMNQSIVGIKSVKLSSREDFFSNNFAKNYLGMTKTEMLLSNLQRLTPEILLFLGQAMLVILVFIFHIIGLTAGEVVSQMTLLLLVSSRVIPAINKISNNISGIWDASAFIENVQKVKSELVRKSTSIFEQDNNHVQITPGWKCIQLRNLEFCHHEDGDFVLRGLNLNLEQGKSYGVVGPSGSGKTTLIDIVLGLLEPTDGSILVDGIPLVHSNLKSWQSCIGYVPQTPFILHDTLRANIAFGVPLGDVSALRIEEVIRLSHLGSVVESLTDGLDTVLGENGVRLSGGQRQRVAIARALYAKPDFLVLDEATSALDSRSEKEIQAAIEGLHGYTTSLIIAHRVSTLRNCDKIFVIDNGELVAHGTFDELLTASNMFRELADK